MNESSLFFGKNQPEFSLRRLVAAFEQNPQNPQTPDKIPKDFLNYFGPLALYKCLNLKLPQPPQFDRLNVEAFMSKQKFPTFESLIKAVGTFPKEIERLYAIFHYAAFHIRYDDELLRMTVRPKVTAEDVFRTGKAICSGYTLFFQAIAERTNIQKIKIHKFSCYGKTGDWYWLHPSDPKSNHASLLIVIDNEKFLCDPT
jgi:hypothetical protein